MKGFPAAPRAPRVSFRLAVPADVEEAVHLLADDPTAVPIAGGTDLLLDLDAGRLDPRTVVSLRRLPWTSIRWEGPRLTIGSTAPLARLEADARVRTELAGLWSAVRAVGSLPLRERATVGGNLGRSSPASDLLPILLALDASVDIVGPAGSRTVPVAGLLARPRRPILAPGELVRAVHVPEPRPSAYRWQRVRPANDISQVGVAVAYSPTAGTWAVAAGGTLPVPVRLGTAERALRGARPTADSVAEAARAAAGEAAFQTDRRASEEYRRELLALLLTRAVGDAAHGSAP